MSYYLIERPDGNHYRGISFDEAVGKAKALLSATATAQHTPFLTLWSVIGTGPGVEWIEAAYVVDSDGQVFRSPSPVVRRLSWPTPDREAHP